MHSEWDKLAEPFAEDQLDWRVEKRSSGKTFTVPYPKQEALIERIEQHFGPYSWQDSYELLMQTPITVKARLSLHIDGLGMVSREDVGTGESFPEALAHAFQRAALKFGLGRELQEGAQEGVEASEPPSTTFQAPQEAEEVKPDAHKHIDALMEQLKAQGMGKEAAKAVMRYGGYGKNLDESRQLFVELRNLLKTT
jgi:hypothetical protein